MSVSYEMGEPALITLSSDMAIREYQVMICGTSGRELDEARLILTARASSPNYEPGDSLMFVEVRDKVSRSGEIDVEFTDLIQPLEFAPALDGPDCILFEHIVRFELADVNSPEPIDIEWFLMVIGVEVDADSTNVFTLEIEELL